MLTLGCRLPLEIQLWKLSTFSGWSKTCLHCNGDQKKIDEKNIFHRNFWLKIHIFHGIWRSLNPSSCLLLACNWLKYDYETFLQSLGVAKHVRIGLKNIKNFCWNKSFHRNFWLKFDISHGAITRKVPYVTTLSVKKNLRPCIKNPLPQFCWAWSVVQLKYPQHGHISWIEGYKKSKAKKVKNIRLSALLK